ncbi:O-antigen ligase family protein [Hafnia alvei]|uniref:O-antigen ligase family protein n=1 Tax=Hafnia alvei TaxID=569 RepID=UPI000E0E2E15|nr:O-antigen ligase family protein [Hafnia alvei]
MNSRSSIFIYSTILFCSFFSINSLPINPVYIIGFIMLACVAGVSCLRGKLNKFSLVVILFSLLILISQIIGIISESNVNIYPNGVNYLTPILFFYSMIICIGISEYANRISHTVRVKIYKKMYALLSIFLLIELISRILISDLSKGFLYAFKSSLFYFDSNFTGLVIITFFSLFLYLKNNLDLKLKYSKVVLILFSVLTFSRAVYVTLFAMLYAFRKPAHIKGRSLVVILSTILVFTYMIVRYVVDKSSFSNIDGSFNSKFYIVNRAIDFYSTQPLSVHLFGIGLGNTEQLLGIFAHNIFVTMIIELGFVGSLLFLFFIYYSIKVSNGYALYLWVPTFICGISLFSAYSPFLFVANAIICAEEKIKRI